VLDRTPAKIFNADEADKCDPVAYDGNDLVIAMVVDRFYSKSEHLKICSAHFYTFSHHQKPGREPRTICQIGSATQASSWTHPTFRLFYEKASTHTVKKIKLIMKNKKAVTWNSKIQSVINPKANEFGKNLDADNCPVHYNNSLLDRQYISLPLIKEY